LTTALADGPRIVSEVKQEGTSRGFGKSTIERAAVDLGLSPQRVGSKNYWTLPASLTQRPEEVEEVAVSGPPPPEDAPEEEHFRWLEANRQAVSNAVRRHRAVLLSVADHLGIQSLVSLQRFINRDETLGRIFRETWSRNLDTMLHSAMTKGLKGDRSMQQFFLRGSYNPLEAGPEDEEEDPG